MMTKLNWTRCALVLCMISSRAAAGTATDNEAAPAATADAGPAAAREGEPADEDLGTRVRDLEQLVEELERKAALQRVVWSADYRITLSHFRYHGPSPEDRSKTVSLRNDEQWTHRVRLSLRAEPTPSLRFRARLIAFKRFGDSSFDLVADAAQSRVPRDSTPRFDRFWLDWFLTPHLSLSLGRTSTTDGSPAELRENLDKPAATLPAGLVDSESDAVAMTYENGPLVLRAYYLAWQFRRPSDVYAQLPFLARDEAPIRILGLDAQVRPMRPGQPMLELSGYVIPKTTAVPPTGLPQPDGSVVDPSQVPSLGRLVTATALVLWRDLLPGRLDAFASLSASYSDPNGRAIEYPIGPDGAPVPVLTTITTGASTHVGILAYGGVRTTLPLGGKHAPKLGFEATYGSRYLISFATPTADLVSRFGVRGRTFDTYAIVPITSGMFARANWTLLDYDYPPAIGGALGLVEALGGPAPPTEQRVQALQLTLHTSF